MAPTGRAPLRFNLHTEVHAETRGARRIAMRITEGDSRTFSVFIAFRVNLFREPKQKCLARPITSSEEGRHLAPNGAIRGAIRGQTRTQ
jgi:hypothetical protein